jgi:hypothetical protein
MQGDIHKRIHTCKDGRQTIRWYVVVDVDRGSTGGGARSGTAALGPGERHRSSVPGS